MPDCRYHRPLALGNLPFFFCRCSAMMSPLAGAKLFLTRQNPYTVRKRRQFVPCDLRWQRPGYIFVQ